MKTNPSLPSSKTGINLDEEVRSILDKFSGDIDSSIDMVLGSFLRSGRTDLLRFVLRQGFRFVQSEVRYEQKAQVKREPIPEISTPVYIDPNNFKKEQAERRSQQAASAAASSKSTKIFTDQLDKARRKIILADTIYEKWILNNGKKLGDATRVDLAHSRDADRRSADGHLRNVNFYEDIIMLMKDDQQIVRDVVSVDVVDAIREKIYETY